MNFSWNFNSEGRFRSFAHTSFENEMETTLEVVQGIDDAEQVIVHFDLDCFFVQVERKRYPRLMGKPMVVHQHKDIISASYEGKGLIFLI